MQAQGGGVIINISSNVSKMAIPGIGAYASTKYALNGLSLTARNELAADNIRVVLFHPGQTSTDFGKNALIAERISTALAGTSDAKIHPCATGVASCSTDFWRGLLAQERWRVGIL